MPYIGRGSDFGVRSRFIYTATAGQTSFSGNDDAGITLAYTDTLYMDVYQNGVLLVPATDYAASTGTSVVLVQGASVDDTLEILVHDIFSVADSVSKKDGGAFSGNLSATDITATGTLNAQGDTAAGDNAAIGDTTAEGLILTGQGSTDDITIKNDADTTVLNVATGGTDVEISAGNLLLGTAGKGIDFSNQASPTGGMTSELMDRYEEGTFTPTVSSDASPAGYTTQNGYYTRIGRVVHITAVVQVSDMGSFSGATVQLGGLPFTVANLTNYEPVGTCVLDGAANAKSNIFLRFIANASHARLETNNGATDHDNNMNANAFDTGTILKVSGTYFTAT